MIIIFYNTIEKLYSYIQIIKYKWWLYIYIYITSKEIWSQFIQKMKNKWWLYNNSKKELYDYALVWVFSLYGNCILLKNEEIIGGINIFAIKINRTIKYIQMITISTLMVVYQLVSRIKLETYDKSIKLVGMRISNLYFIDASLNNDLMSGWENSPLLIILILLFIIIWFCIMPLLTFKHWHRTIEEFSVNYNIKWWCLDNLKCFSIIGSINITSFTIITMIRKFVLISILFNWLLNSKIEIFYRWQIELVIVMLIYSNIMAWMSLSNKKHKYGYYTKYSIICVGLSGLLLLLALMNKFGLYESYFGYNNSLYLLCTCYLNELLLILSKLFNNSIIDKTFLFKLFNYFNIDKISLFIQHILKFTMPMRLPLNSIYNIFGGFNFNVLKMNVVGESSIGNNQGQGGGNVQSASTNPRVIYPLNNDNQHRTYLWNSNIQYTTPIHSNYSEMFKNMYTDPIEWGTKSRNGVVCPLYFYDKLEFIPFKNRIIDWQYGELMKARLEYYKRTNLYGIDRDDMLRHNLVINEENGHFIKSTILDITSELLDDRYSTNQLDSQNSSTPGRFMNNPLYYIGLKYNKDTNIFEDKSWALNRNNPISVRIYNNLAIIDTIKAEALCGDIYTAINVRLNPLNTIDIPEGLADWAKSTIDMALRRPNDEGLNLHQEMLRLFNQKNMTYPQYIVVLDAIDLCFDALWRDIATLIYINKHSDLPLFNPAQEMIVKRQILVGLHYCKFITKHELITMFRIGKSNELRSNLFDNLRWDMLDCSKDSPIVRMLRERNPDIFKPHVNDGVYLLTQ